MCVPTPEFLSEKRDAPVHAQAFAAVTDLGCTGIWLHAFDARMADAAQGRPGELTDEQILERLLALNLERADEEAKAAKVKKPKASRAKSAEEML